MQLTFEQKVYQRIEEGIIDSIQSGWDWVSTGLSFVPGGNWIAAAGDAISAGVDVAQGQYGDAAMRGAAAAAGLIPGGGATVRIGAKVGKLATAAAKGGKAASKAGTALAKYGDEAAKALNTTTKGVADAKQAVTSAKQAVAAAQQTGKGVADAAKQLSQANAGLRTAQKAYTKSSQTANAVTKAMADPKAAISAGRKAIGAKVMTATLRPGVVGTIGTALGGGGGGAGGGGAYAGIGASGHRLSINTSGGYYGNMAASYEPSGNLISEKVENAVTRYAIDGDKLNFKLKVKKYITQRKSFNPRNVGSEGY